jgi:hypothetical protein
VFVTAAATTDAHCSDAAYTILTAATVTAAAADGTYSSITVTFQVSYIHSTADQLYPHLLILFQTPSLHTATMYCCPVTVGITVC